MDTINNGILALIISPLLIAGIGFFIKKWISDISSEIKQVRSEMHGYAMAIEIVKSEQSNTKEDVGELKADIKHVWRRFDHQKDEIEKTKIELSKVKSAQENCPARNKTK